MCVLYVKLAFCFVHFCIVPKIIYKDFQWYTWKLKLQICSKKNRTEMKDTKRWQRLINTFYIPHKFETEQVKQFTLYRSQSTFQTWRLGFGTKTRECYIHVFFNNFLNKSLDSILILFCSNQISSLKNQSIISLGQGWIYIKISLFISLISHLMWINHILGISFLIIIKQMLSVGKPFLRLCIISDLMYCENLSSLRDS